MKRMTFGAVALAASLLGASAAQAAVFSVDLCDVNPGECAGDGLTEASLVFTEVAGGDINDYTLVMTLTGTTAGDFVDSVSFTISGASTPGGYEALPGVVGPAGDTWTPFFDNINGAAGDCAANDNTANEVCAQSGGEGLAAGFPGSYVWTWTIDLADDVAPLADGREVNFRANFIRFNPNVGGGRGAWQNSGNLSPDFGPLDTDGGGTDDGIPDTGNLPEPTMLALLGAGLAALGYRARRKI